MPTSWIDILRPGRLAKNTLAMTTGMGLRTLGQAVVFLVIARLLGAEAYGAYSAVLALAMTASGFAGIGVSMLMLRDTARNPKTFKKAWGRTLAALCITIPALLFGYSWVAWTIIGDQVVWSVILCIGAAEILISPFAVVSIHAYQGHERIGRAARLILAPILPRLAAAIIFIPVATYLEAPARLPTWTFLYLVATIFAGGYAVWLVRCDLGGRFSLHWSGMVKAIREGWSFSAGWVAQKVYVDIDKVMLARMTTLDAAGAYSAAYRLLDMASVPLLSLLTAATPRFFRAGETGPMGAASYALRILPIPMGYALLISVALYSFAGLLPWLLGESFKPAAETLRWLSWMPALTITRLFLQTALGTSGNQNLSVAIMTGGAFANILLNMWAIPLWTWKGAVFSTYVAELAMILGYFLFFIGVRH